MIRIPNAVGLLLCQQTVVEAGTGNVTLVNTFVNLKQRVFPTPPMDFLVVAMLTDGSGETTLSLVLEELDTLEDLAVSTLQANFTHPMNVYRLRVRVPAVEFPRPGRYQLTLLADGDWVAQCAFAVTALEE